MSHALLYTFKWGNEVQRLVLYEVTQPTKKFKTLDDKGVKYFNLIKKDFCFQASCIEAVPRAALLLSTNIYWNSTTSHSKKLGVLGKMRIPPVRFQHWIEAWNVLRKSLQYEKPLLLNTSTWRAASPILSLHQGRHQPLHFLFVRLYPLNQGFPSSSMKGSPGPTLPSSRPGFMDMQSLPYSSSLRHLELSPTSSSFKLPPLETLATSCYQPFLP